MSKKIAALAAVMVLFGLACSDTPTTLSPNVPKPPVISMFTVDPATLVGSGRVDLFFWITYEDKATLNIRLEQNGETIVFRSPYYEDAPYALVWSYIDEKPSVTFGYTYGIDETTTFKLTASDDAGTITQSRIVTVQ